MSPTPPLLITNFLMCLAALPNIPSHLWRRCGSLSFMLNQILEYHLICLILVYTSTNPTEKIFYVQLQLLPYFSSDNFPQFCSPPSVKPSLAPEDEELLRDDDVVTPLKKDGIRKKERPTDKGVSWLVKTQYISPLSLESAKQVTYGLFYIIYLSK